MGVSHVVADAHSRGIGTVAREKTRLTAPRCRGDKIAVALVVVALAAVVLAAAAAVLVDAVVVPVECSQRDSFVTATFPCG